MKLSSRWERGREERRGNKENNKANCKQRDDTTCECTEKEVELREGKLTDILWEPREEVREMPECTQGERKPAKETER